ncbi:hypothetical protein MtrunA17_Chr3g0097111 [Medicago truncatula]|uniref:Transmembrane protein, putative n=1 Tax=Medicago truncatula TaxID=3880 RepID=A0A072V6H3_MEDTR|nr:transmembrane protein, putative [Medicago truncatula]RHN66925.1 hypothetical protein MtrunA17_Chr3g0097111 [Medicago truncatula]
MCNKLISSSQLSGVSKGFQGNSDNLCALERAILIVSQNPIRLAQGLQKIFFALSSIILNLVRHGGGLVFFYIGVLSLCCRSFDRGLYRRH